MPPSRNPLTTPNPGDVWELFSPVFMESQRITIIGLKEPNSIELLIGPDLVTYPLDLLPEVVNGYTFAFSQEWGYEK